MESRLGGMELFQAFAAQLLTYPTLIWLAQNDLSGYQPIGEKVTVNEETGEVTTQAIYSDEYDNRVGTMLLVAFLEFINHFIPSTYKWHVNGSVYSPREVTEKYIGTMIWYFAWQVIELVVMVSYI